MTRTRLILAAGMMILAGCGGGGADSPTRLDANAQQNARGDGQGEGQVERIVEPYHLPTDDILEPAPADMVPTADLTQILEDARLLPEALEDAEVRTLLGMYAPPSRKPGTDDREAARLSYVLLFDVLSRPIGPPLPEGTTLKDPGSAPAVVVAVYDATTGERLRVSTVGCGVTHTCQLG